MYLCTVRVRVCVCVQACTWRHHCLVERGSQAWGSYKAICSLLLCAGVQTEFYHSVHSGLRLTSVLQSQHLLGEGMGIFWL